jgi:hypothetical protein
MLKPFRNIILMTALFGATGLSAQGYASPFGVRGIYIDQRTQVMTPEALKSLVADAAREGINTVIMEYEATFPFSRHATLCNPLRFSEAEVKEFVDYCEELGVDVIPLQNCFGHCEYILRHDRYASLREDKSDMSQVCPSQTDEAVRVFGEIFDEVARLHPSPYFHIGADETRLLGHCKQCRAKAASEGTSKLLIDYLSAMCRVVVEMGKTPIVWADMLLQYPEAMDELPKQTVVVDWNYGWSPKHFGDVDALRRHGFTVWGATALRSSPDNVYLTQWNKHFENLATFIPFARQHDYSGMINTSWSTSGRYGYTYDNGWEVMAIQPIRQVYPHSGFDILQHAYTAALSDTAWQAEPFIIDYGKRRFGLGEEGQQALLAYMQMKQEQVVTAKASPEKLDATLAEAEAMQQRLAKQKPKRNLEEWQHLLLMLDIRINYLRFKQAELEYESASFDTAKAPALARRLDALTADTESLTERYNRLNAHFLKNPAESFGHCDYVEKMRYIRDCLTPLLTTD